MSDRINLSDKDFKRKSFKVAPGGIYRAKITTKSKIKPGSSGNILNVHAKITRGPHKGVTFFDNIAPHVGWKVAQLLNAVGKKIKKLTLQQLLKIVVGAGEVRAQLRQEKFNGRDQNKVVTWLPLKGAVTAGGEDEDEEEQDEDEELDEDETTDEDEETTDEDETTEEDEETTDEDEATDEDEMTDEDEETTEEDDEDLLPEDDDEEEEPRKKSKKSKKARREKGKKKSRR